MSFDLNKILEGKRALRRDLAARPVAEKLRMLDALRERALTLRAASVTGQGELEPLFKEHRSREGI